MQKRSQSNDVMTVLTFIGIQKTSNRLFCRYVYIDWS